jgi:predicted transcriptional regulator
MYHSHPAAERAWSSDLFPQEVLRLYRREREIAMIVYDRGLVTAKDVEAALCHSLSNAAVRSMLDRLVRKEILTQVRCGSRGAFVYGPALTQSAAAENALKQFAGDFYGGSLDSVAEAIAQMFANEKRHSAAALETQSEYRLAS